MAHEPDRASNPKAFRSGARKPIRVLEPQERTLPSADLPADRRWTPSERAALARAAVEAQHALREAAAAAADAAAHARSLADVLDEALADLPRVEKSRGNLPHLAIPASPAAIPLSPREREVLALVAEGRSNKAIAEALFVSPNTVKTHVASLLNKHNAGSRAQLAAIAAGRVFG